LGYEIYPGKQRGIGKDNKDYRGYGIISVLGKTKQTKILYSVCDAGLQVSMKMHAEERWEAAVKLVGARYRTSKRRYFSCST